MSCVGVGFNNKQNGPWPVSFLAELWYLVKPLCPQNLCIYLPGWSDSSEKRSHPSPSFRSWLLGRGRGSRWDSFNSRVQVHTFDSHMILAWFFCYQLHSSHQKCWDFRGLEGKKRQPRNGCVSTLLGNRAGISFENLLSTNASTLAATYHSSFGVGRRSPITEAWDMVVDGGILPGMCIWHSTPWLTCFGLGFKTVP